VVHRRAIIVDFPIDKSVHAPEPGPALEVWARQKNVDGGEEGAFPRPPRFRGRPRAATTEG